jgi:quinolinate synthase
MNLKEEILKLKKEKNAIILAHNYQIMPVQEIADFIGDSLQLAQEAEKVKADIILFCGVQFMAETAKLLNPEAKVLLSATDAGCPMADMITGKQLKKFKSEHKDPYVVCYVNSNVEVKAESDICCTSGNAIKIINSIPENKTILFVPDQNLGTYAAQQTGREIIVWQGFCNVHHVFIKPEDITKAREQYPNYKIIVHPECKPEIFNKADVVASTKGMADFAAENDNIVLGTEIGLFEQLKAKFPHKNIVPLSTNAVCRNMKKTALEDVFNTLLNEENEIQIQPDVASKAVKSIHKMLELS